MFREIFTEARARAGSKKVNYNFSLAYYSGDFWPEDEKKLKKFRYKMIDNITGRAKATDDQGSYDWRDVQIFLEPSQFANRSELDKLVNNLKGDSNIYRDLEKALKGK